MSYLVLARKWRPKRFAELVGQEHVVRALSNALDSGRVHHAFLFTGTRGVGKTTIARIFAKSLNCERGVGAEPCGQCAICSAVDAGRFVDLIEIDAASNTGVDDVREVIENAQYMPTRGRYKVYLVDEVHMLSRNAFNALLKTLEEPPEHVKFLLATTDPQKLPVTVLSRCLQFNLKRLTPEQIGTQMRSILAAEQIGFESTAIDQLAHAADGSLRDGLSLLDQAIAYGGGELKDRDVATMLGTVDRAQVGAVLQALVDGNGSAMLAAIDHLAGYSPDFAAVLDELASSLHRLQLCQLVPESADAGPEVTALAARVSAELVQLWYQMALSGRRDLPLAPTPRIGFEMAMLRMLAFRPLGQPGGGDEPPPKATLDKPSTARQAPPLPPALRGAEAGRAAVASADAEPAAAPRPAPALMPASVSRPPVPAAHSGEPTPPAPATDIAAFSSPFAAAAAAAGVRVDGAAAAPTEIAVHSPPARRDRMLLDAEDWLDAIAGLGLKGPVRELAASAAFVSHLDDRLKLALNDLFEHLRLPSLVQQLADALADVLGHTPTIEFVAAHPAIGGETLHDRNRRERDARQADAEASFMADPVVQRLMQHHEAKLVPDSIRPSDG